MADSGQGQPGDPFPGGASRGKAARATASRPEGSRPEGLLSSAKAALESLLRILQTRGELLATEIQEEQARLASQLALAFVAILCLSLAVILTTLLVVVFFWDTYRLLAIVLLALVFFGVGGSCAMVFVQRAKRRPVLFSASLRELERDRDSLRGSPREPS